MTEQQSDRPPIGLWAMIAVSLILSVTAIVLYLSGLSNDSLHGNSPEYMQVISMNQQLKAEIAQLQAAISSASNFQALRQSLQQQGTTGVMVQPGFKPLTSSTDSPMVAIMVLEQSQINHSFDEYQRVQPRERQDALEQIYSANRELRRVYDELNGALAIRFGSEDPPELIVEEETSRLGRLLFRQQCRYEVLEKIREGDDKATLKVKLMILATSASGQRVAAEAASTTEGKMQAVKEGENWKISEHSTIVAKQDKLLAQMKKRITEGKALVAKLNKGEVKKWVDFLKAWEALPSID